MTLKAMLHYGARCEKKGQEDVLLVECGSTDAEVQVNHGGVKLARVGLNCQ